MDSYTSPKILPVQQGLPYGALFGTIV